VSVPVGLWRSLVAADQPEPGLRVHDRLYCNSQFSDDEPLLKSLMDKLGAFDLSEPFSRIREAMQEARKMGVTMRRAA
jgi:hypothetical protein